MLAWSEIQLLTVVRHLNVFVRQKEEVVQDAYSSVDLGAEIKMQNESELNQNSQREVPIFTSVHQSLSYACWQHALEI